MKASIYDFELVEETGERMNPSAPAHAKSWKPDMHTCIIVRPKSKHIIGYRILTTTQAPGPEFTLGKYVTLGSDKQGSLGDWQVLGLVNIFTMNSVGAAPDKLMLHWILK